MVKSGPINTGAHGLLVRVRTFLWYPYQLSLFLESADKMYVVALSTHTYISLEKWPAKVVKAADHLVSDQHLLTVLIIWTQIDFIVVLVSHTNTPPVISNDCD